MARWRHRKRGTFYVEIGRGHLQIEGPADGAAIVLYRAEEDGALWARPVAEFEDGRFERVAEAPRTRVARWLVRLSGARSAPAESR